MKELVKINQLPHLAAELGVILQEKCWVLALAESCTGGMAAQAVTSVAGSSACFERGFVTYSNQAKIDMLGVLAVTIDTFGAVSEETAQEMATGALKNSHAHIAGSITGIAGPAGGTPEKPVGTVCFGVAQASQCITSTQHFTGNREQIRQQATVFLMQQLIERVK